MATQDKLTRSPLDTGESLITAAAPRVQALTVENIRSSSYGQSHISIFPETRNYVGVYEFDAGGALNLIEPVALFDEFVLQSVVESNKDNTQIFLSSDAPKIKVFGQSHWLFSISAVLLDTDLNRTIETPGVTEGILAQTDQQLLQNRGWTGSGIANWRIFYESFACLPVCAKNRWLVGFYYMGRTFYGAFTQSNIVQTASEPHRAFMSSSFYAVHVDSGADISRVVRGIADTLT